MLHEIHIFNSQPAAAVTGSQTVESVGAHLCFVSSLPGLHCAGQHEVQGALSRENVLIEEN